MRLKKFKFPVTTYMYLLIDNYDSFTYNLYQAFAKHGIDLLVKRNDKITLDEIISLRPAKIVISPGPKTPDNAGISNLVIERLGAFIPILGICLGHQCIAKNFGGKISKVRKIIHGKTSSIYHSGKGVLKGVPSPFNGARYHSLHVSWVPKSLEIIAETSDKLIMGIAHKKWPLTGLQFHPESFLTEHGQKIIKNFIRL